MICRSRGVAEVLSSLALDLEHEFLGSVVLAVDLQVLPFFVGDFLTVAVQCNLEFLVLEHLEHTVIEHIARDRIGAPLQFDFGDAVRCDTVFDRIIVLASGVCAEIALALPGSGFRTLIRISGRFYDC